MLDLEVGYTSFVEKLRSERFFRSTLSLILFADLYLLLSVKEGILSLRADALRTISIKDVALFVVVYVFLEGFVIPALYGWYVFVMLLIKGRGDSLIARFMRQYVRALHHALSSGNSVAYEVLQRISQRLKDLHELGGATLSLVILCLAELLAAIEADVPPLLEDIVLRAFRIGPPIGFAAVVLGGFFFVNLFSSLIRSTRWIGWVERNIVFGEILPTAVTELQGKWHYSGTAAQHWPAADG